MSSEKKLICVDLDGTLIRGDLSAQALSGMMRLSRKKQMALLLELRKSYARFKKKLSEEIPLNHRHLIYNIDLIKWLMQKKNEGAKLVLASASSEIYVKRIFDDIKIFDDYHGSTEDIHLIGRHKGRYLAKKYGFRRFIYCGNSWIDLFVWHYASHAVTVRVSPLLKSLLKQRIEIIREF